MNPLQQLYAAGQSYWLDNLSRDLLISGELKERIKSQDLRGITTNPAIFNKAVANSALYDDQIKQLALRNQTKEEIYEALVTQDVIEACNQLMPVYAESEATDGFVSLEVSPHLARNTDGSIEEARHLFATVNRPNLMIKIPATVEGLPAIGDLLRSGINVNITLLFSIDRYNAVAQTFIRAMQDRVRNGHDISKTASVASFFLSRIDVLVDQLLQHRTRDTAGSQQVNIDELYGKAAVASAKLAYNVLQKRLATTEWLGLKRHGAEVQRLLWASTGTKNPDYSDVIYVEPLIGPFTVTTLPEETSDAFADHGRIENNSVTHGLDAATSHVKQLEQVGIDMHAVTAQLENEGIQKFIDPYEQLLQTIDQKRQSFIAKQNGLQHQKW